MATRRKSRARSAASRGRAERARRTRPPPSVRLGRTVTNGVAPSMFGLLERGVARRPEVAARTRGKVVLRFSEPFAPLRVTFASRTITVEDGDARS